MLRADVGRPVTTSWLVGNTGTVVSSTSFGTVVLGRVTTSVFVVMVEGGSDGGLPPLPHSVQDDGKKANRATTSSAPKGRKAGNRKGVQAFKRMESVKGEPKMDKGIEQAPSVKNE